MGIQCLSFPPDWYLEYRWAMQDTSYSLYNYNNYNAHTTSPRVCTYCMQSLIWFTGEMSSLVVTFMKRHLWALLLPLFIFYSSLLCCTLLSTLLFFTSCNLPLLPWWLRKWNVNNFTGYTVTCIVPPTMYNNYFPKIAKLYLKLPVTTIIVMIIITIIIINILIYILLLSQLSIQWRWKIMTLTRMRWFIIQC